MRGRTCRTKLTNTASCLGPRSSPGLQEQGIRDAAEVRREEMDARHARSITILVLLLLLHALPRRCLALADKTALTAAAFYTESRSLRKLLLLLLLYPWVPSFPKGMFGRVRTKVYRGYLLRIYLTEPYRSVRYGLNTLPNYTGVFGTNSIPVPDTLVRVYRGYTEGMYLFTLPKWFGTTSIPVPDSTLSSVRPQYRCPMLR